MNRSFVINAMLLSYVQITDIQTDTTQACILNIYIYIYCFSYLLPIIHLKHLTEYQN